MPSNYLQIKDLSCGYGSDFNLRPITVGLRRGALAGIIGPNGSGKTTLFKGISGQLPLKSGSVWLNNCNLQSLKLRQKPGA